MTSQPIEPNHIQQTLSLGAFPVSQSPKQGTEKASRRLQGLVFGFNSSEPYAWYDQNTSSWKTYQRSLLTDWTSFSETFTRQGTMQNGVVYQAALLELATKEIDGGLLDSLPTPRASEPGRTNLGYGDNLKEGICKQIGIPTKKYPMLPTPTATDYKGRSGQGFIERHGKRRISDVLTQTGDNTYLNPRFVEEMMGYPLNWTQVKESKD